MRIDHHRWRELDARLEELQGGIDLDSYLSPRNRAAEFERWSEARREGRRYDPRFEFDALPEVRETDLRHFLEILHPADPVEAMVGQAVRLRLGEILMCRTRDGGVISRESCAAYGRPDERVLRLARRNLARPVETEQALEGRLLEIDEIAEICRQAMAEYGFDWQVVVKQEMGCKALVDNLRREFWIRSDVVWPAGVMKMVVVHEIGTHILRTENGYAQPLGIFGRGLPAYQLTEEGLAEYTEQQTGCLHQDTIRRISARVLGVDVALRGSFSDVVEAVLPFQEPAMAFDIAQRAKLGQADTSLPGAYTKDYVYLAGYDRLQEWFAADPAPEDLAALFAGKVGLHQLDLVRKLQAAGYLALPRVYPEWLEVHA